MLRIHDRALISGNQYSDSMLPVDTPNSTQLVWMKSEMPKRSHVCSRPVCLYDHPSSLQTEW